MPLSQGLPFDLIRSTPILSKAEGYERKSEPVEN
jgi:hypothetical protein